jgi:small GTP-binding protein domain
MKIVNVGIVAHVDAGKTTITEQLLYRSGVLRKAGSVDSGTSQTDFMEVERARGISVKSSSVTIVRNDVQINLIDTPGHVDFAAEVERSLSVLDTAVLVISAVEGVQAQTEILFEALRQTHTNVIFFINKIDRAGSDISRVLRQIREKFTKNILLMTGVENEGEKTCSAVVLSLQEEGFQEVVIDSVSEFDDGIFSAYVASQKIGEADLRASLKNQVLLGNVCPVLCGSAFFGAGMEELLDCIAEYAEPVKNNETDELSGVVYKITHDKTVGRIAHVRLFGGGIKTRDSVKLSSSSDSQKVTQIRRYSGPHFTDIGEVRRGDIAALCGLSNARISDIIGEAYRLSGYKMSVPLMKVQVIPAKSEDLYPLIGAFEELSAEDPQLDMEYSPDEKEIDVSITGTIQLEVLSAIVRERYGLDITFSPPTVIYKETPSRSGNGYEAYTMPKPCWAIVSLDIEPGARGSGLEYRSVVPNDRIFYRYQNHIETTVPRALKQGLYNWEVTDLKVTLVDGSHHTVHTHPMDFFLATPMAVMNGLQNTGTTLLEPVILMRIAAPEEFAGKVIGDVIAMRGEYDSPVISDGVITLEAKVPVAPSLDYAVRLASMTSGRGILSTRFAGYQECPPELGRTAKRRGVNPLDRERWILNQRNALV